MKYTKFTGNRESLLTLEWGAGLCINLSGCYTQLPRALWVEAAQIYSLTVVGDPGSVSLSQSYGGSRATFPLGAPGDSISHLFLSCPPVLACGSIQLCSSESYQPCTIFTRTFVQHLRSTWIIQRPLVAQEFKNSICRVSPSGSGNTDTGSWEGGMDATFQFLFCFAFFLFF